MRSLRISVTDRCDLRCAYCMPSKAYQWLPKRAILSFEEILRLVDAFVEQGVQRVRLTGGEPLLRGGLINLVQDLAARPGVKDLALTTNGTQLARWARPLRDAGLARVTVSLDSLRPGRHVALTRRAVLGDVISGIRAARDVGFEQLKLNTVVLRDVNDDEIPDIADFAERMNAQARFVEYMDVGGATDWSTDRVVTRSEILQQLEAHGGPLMPDAVRGAAPAEMYTMANGRRVGVIASTTQPFCRYCDRSRLTADGRWYLCLYGEDGIDLRRMLRNGADTAKLSTCIVKEWRKRQNRGAEERLRVPERSALYQIHELNQDSRLEMHTRGG
jgi:cyclic pyranopterin phosphate synthase